MSSEEAVRADAMETVVEVRARRRDGGVDSRETRARGVGRVETIVGWVEIRISLGAWAFHRGRRARCERAVTRAIVGKDERNDD